MLKTLTPTSAQSFVGVSLIIVDIWPDDEDEGVLDDVELLPLQPTSSSGIIASSPTRTRVVREFI
jgi:hypothetical protein